MEIEKIKICGIPAIIYNKRLKSVYLFVHGKCGCKEEAERFAVIAEKGGFACASIDLPRHGERKNTSEEFLPWVADKEICAVYDFLAERYDCVCLRANSIGAYFCMLALENKKVGRALFASPIVDMRALIESMMKLSNVSEERLKSEKQIATNFGETLSYEYLTFARKNALLPFNADLRLLYGENDAMTSKESQAAFSALHGNCPITVLKGGEHWLHTPEEVAFMSAWEEQNI